VFVLGTNLTETLAMGEDNIFKRLKLFSLNRDNSGVMAIDKDMETFQNVAAPLGTLDVLQAQSQEHVASAVGIPLVKYTGISPSGLNATAEPEMDCFNTWINAYQELLFRPNLTKLLGFIQLSKFGNIDPDITFEFEPLQPLDEVELSTVRQTEAATGEVLIRTGAITPQEERERVAADPDSPYSSLEKKVAAKLDADMADIGTKVTAAIMQVSEAGKISDATVLRELKNASKATGLFTTLTDADISDAEQEPPDPMSDLVGPTGGSEMGGPGQPGEEGGASAEDEWSDEARAAAIKARQSAGGGVGGPEREDRIKELRKHLLGKSMAEVAEALKDITPKIKVH
jgi:uncharacterized protein